MYYDNWAILFIWCYLALGIVTCLRELLNRKKKAKVSDISMLAIRKSSEENEVVSAGKIENNNCASGLFNYIT